MTREELNYIKDVFSQIIDDIAGNPDWPSAAVLTHGKQDGDVAYLRKDVLLEWAKEMKEQYVERIN